MICALLVFGSAELPAPLWEISPWLDWRVVPREEVLAQLRAQKHRRIIKTHTPLDGIPLDPRATYLVGARHPLDMAVSLYHQGANLDRELVNRLTGHTDPPDDRAPRPPLHEWLTEWIAWGGDPQERLDSLPGVMLHLSDAWSRRDESNIVLVRYEDLLADRAGGMRRLSARLGIPVPDELWGELITAAGFEHMRSRADRLAPDPVGVLRSRRAFFRRGRAGAGDAVLTDAEMALYSERARQLAPPDLLQWLHGAGPDRPSDG